MKLILIAQNYNEPREIGALDSHHLSQLLTPQQKIQFATNYPKLALVLALKYPAQFKFLLKTVLNLIESEPKRFMRNKEALHLYLNSKLSTAANSTQLA